MFNEKVKLIENLTGVNSSKPNFYTELKKRNEEVVRQNNRLEIINQLVRDINIDMTIADIIKRINNKMPLVVPCDFLGLALLRQDNLFVKAAMPFILNRANPIHPQSFLWQVLKSGEAGIFDTSHMEDPFLGENPDLAEYARSLAVAPLFIRSSVEGVLLVGCRQPSAYSPSELNFIHQLADQLAICVLNVRLYKQVSRAKSEWEATFNSVTEPIVLIDMDFNILRSNKYLPAETLPGEEDGAGQKCYAWIWGRDERCEECLMDEALKTGKPVYSQIQADTGSVYDISYYPFFNEHNLITGVIHHMKDVTEKTKMEVQLMQSAKLAAIGEMAAGVAHELNNPMTVIIGTAQLMQRDMKDDSTDELLNDIIGCGLRCKKIIQNLLIFSKQDEYPIAQTDLNDELERVLSLIHYQINKNEIEIVKNYAQGLPNINANGHHLQQVLINFLINARDALEGVKRERKIEVSTSVREDEDGGKWVLATVKDNGAGIAPEDLPKIFNPFYTSKGAVKGTGLGLSVSLGIAEAHGGAIEVESVLDEGSSFSLVLPVEAGK